MGQALNMPAEEREKRHRHNFEHVNTHTSQKWAELFVRCVSNKLVMNMPYKRWEWTM